MTRLVFAVTNDLVYDQRMIRICSSLALHGYKVMLVGRKLPGSPQLENYPFLQKRLYCFFKKGKAFYVEFNLRLFFFLLVNKMDGICAIDLDTIVPCYLVSKIKRIQRIYDAHELFCEMKEIVSRPPVYKIWKWVEKQTVPKFRHGYTVNHFLAAEFNNMYGVNYEVIRSVSVLAPLVIPEKNEKYILYQGSVNEGRSFETLIPAMNVVDAILVICGDGNFMEQARRLVREHRLESKIIFKGKVPPAALRQITVNAYIGITLFEGHGKSNYYSLANRFFDYLHAGIPQLCVDFPVYRELNNKMPFAVLIEDLGPAAIAASLNILLNDKQLYESLQKNCLEMRLQLNWQEEEKKLLAFYRQLNFRFG
jgi:glycosyltransferase involved in cell wall biosynthesis